MVLRNVKRRATALIGAVALLVVAAASPSSATHPDLKIVTPGTLTSYGVVTGYNMYGPEAKYKKYDRTVYIVAYMSKHTSNSVRLDSFKICWSSGLSDKDRALISPVVSQNAVGGQDWVYRSFGSGGCSTWTVGKTFKASKGHELFQIMPRITEPDKSWRAVTLASFTR